MATKQAKRDKSKKNTGKKSSVSAGRTQSGIKPVYRIIALALAVLFAAFSIFSGCYYLFLS